MSASYAISPFDLWTLIGTAETPSIIDVRRRAAFESSPGLIPSSRWRDPERAGEWIGSLDRTRPIVLACKAGHELSQMVSARLRAEGQSAQILAGGVQGWMEAKLPLVSRDAHARFAAAPRMWVTRRRPKIDRVACPWLIRRFVDPEATFLFVDPSEVPAVARETGAIPFDIEGVELSHEGERCSFDTLLRLLGLENEPSLARLALIVRGADTARYDLAAEAAGLHAVSLGLSVLARDDDHGLLQGGFAVYDALFAWIRFAADERHNWPVKAVAGGR